MEQLTEQQAFAHGEVRFYQREFHIGLHAEARGVGQFRMLGNEAVFDGLESHIKGLALAAD